MSLINEKFDTISLRNIHRQLKEIQNATVSNSNLDQEFASVLENVTSVAGMFCDVLEQYLEGKIDADDPLGVMEEKIASAHILVKRMEDRTGSV